MRVEEVPLDAREGRRDRVISFQLMIYKTQEREKETKKNRKNKKPKNREIKKKQRDEGGNKRPRWVDGLVYSLNVGSLL